MASTRQDGQPLLQCNDQLTGADMVRIVAANHQHIPDLQHDVTADPLVVDERAVRAVVRDHCLAVALLERKAGSDAELAAVRAYRAEYGVAA
jgi:hypothetical protein